MYLHCCINFQLGSVDSFKSLATSFQSFLDEDTVFSVNSSVQDSVPVFTLERYNMYWDCSIKGTTLFHWIPIKFCVDYLHTQTLPKTVNMSSYYTTKIKCFYRQNMCVEWMELDCCGCQCYFALTQWYYPN